MSIVDEKQIIEQINNNNQDGFKMLFDVYYKPLCVFSLKYIDSFDESEDVVQEVFVKFWERYKGKKFSGSLKSYLFYSVRNNSLKHISKQKRDIFETLGDLSEVLIDVPDKVEDIEEQKRILHGEVNKLPEQARKVFELIVLEDLRYKEAAEELNLSVNSVKTHLSRALKQLRGSLDTLVFILIAT